MPLFKKKEKEAKLDKDGKPIELDEDMEEGLGSKILMVFVTLLVIMIWLGIIVLLIKSDFGGFGSTILRPMIKDVPYLSWMLPESDEVIEDTEYQYETINDAIERIQELEALLDAQLVANSENSELIEELHAQIADLQIYKLEQDEFEKNKEKWAQLIDLASDLGYNGIAYEVKRLVQKVLLAGKVLTSSRHQDVDTS